MPLPYAFCGPIPTDGPCPPADMLEAVQDQYDNPAFPYATATEAEMSRFQWHGHLFEVDISGNLKIRSNGYPDEWAFADATIPFEFTGLAISAIGTDNMLDRFPAGAFAQGSWVQFASINAKDVRDIDGSHSAYSAIEHSGYTATNYKLHYKIEIGAFLSSELTFTFAEPTVPEAHLYQIGDTYRIPFRVGVRFEADIIKDDPELPDPPGFGIATQASTISGGFVGGGANVVNGDAILFDTPEGVPAFARELTTDEPTVYNAVYFDELVVNIKAKQVAAAPTAP